MTAPRGVPCAAAAVVMATFVASVGAGRGSAATTDSRRWRPLCAPSPTARSCDRQSTSGVYHPPIPPVAVLHVPHHRGSQRRGGPPGQANTTASRDLARVVPAATICRPSKGGVAIATNVGGTPDGLLRMERSTRVTAGCSCLMLATSRGRRLALAESKQQKTRSTCAKSVAPLHLHPPFAAPISTLPRLSSHSLSMLLFHHLKAVQCIPSAAPCRTP